MSNEKELPWIQLRELRRGDVVGMELADVTRGTATIKSVRCFIDAAIDAVIRGGSRAEVLFLRRSLSNSSRADSVKITYIDNGTGDKRTCIASSEDEIEVIVDELETKESDE